MVRLSQCLVGCLIAMLGLTSPACAVDEAAIRAAVARSLPLLERAGENWQANKACFSCHHQTLPMFAAAEAARVGFPEDTAKRKTQADHTHEHFRKLIPRIEAQEHIGGGSTTAGYGLWALSLDDRPRDETTTAVVQYLLDIQGFVRSEDRDSPKIRRAEDGRWMISCRRPPLQFSEVGATVLALAGLRDYASDEQRPAAEAARVKAEAWLKVAKLQDNEDRVWRLWGLHYLGGEASDVAKVREALLSTQRDDGGWSQIDELKSDAFATGQALFILRQTGSDAGDHAMQRAADFLVRTQLDDGSWLVVTRAKAVQTYFDNGDPHAENQFLSTAAASWATAALAQMLPSSEGG